MTNRFDSNRIESTTRYSMRWGREARFDDPHALARYDNVSLVVADTRNAALRRVHFRGPRFGHVETLAAFSSNDLSCPMVAADTTDTTANVAGRVAVTDTTPTTLVARAADDGGADRGRGAASATEAAVRAEGRAGGWRAWLEGGLAAATSDERGRAPLLAAGLVGMVAAGAAVRWRQTRQRGRAAYTLLR